MNRLPFLIGAALIGRRRPRKRESAPGKARQLKMSAVEQDKGILRDQASVRKNAATRKGAGRND